MTTYTVSEIENHIAKIEFEDGSFSYLELNSSMTEAELDDIVSMMIPPKYKSGGSTPSFLKAGAKRTATAIEATPDPAWLSARLAAYGTVESQIEYITENGLDAWQAHVAKIKSDNPKE